MSKARNIRIVAAGFAVAAAVLLPIAATGGLTASAADSGTAGILGLRAPVAAQPATRASTAPGTYVMNVSLNTIPVVTYGGDLTILANGSFTWRPNNVSCDGIWTTTGNWLALEVTGATPTCLSGSAWVLAGHLTRKGIKAGTTNVWTVDSANNPKGFLANGTWSAVRS